MDDVPEIKIETIGRYSIRKEPEFKLKPNFCRNARAYFSEFTNSTSLHGLKYVGERKRSYVERILWFLIISASLSVCVILIKKTYNKWDLTPVVVTFAHSSTPVWKIPFPAVTICPETKSRQTYFNFTRYYHQFYSESRSNMTEEDLRQLNNAVLLCDSDFVEVEISQTTDSALEFMKNTSPTLGDTVYWCQSSHLGNECEEMFSPILTDEGICYSFNMLDRDDIYTTDVYHEKFFLNHGQNSSGWSLEDGYKVFEEIETYPKRTVSAGAQAGLTLLLSDKEENVDLLCRGPIQGFKVILHHPGEIPRVSMQYFRVPFDQEVTVAVKPDMISTSESLRNYNPHRRGCYFATERKLRFYKYYTQQNCQMECLTNTTLARCGCVAFYMPREKSTLVCGSLNIACIKESANKMPFGNAEGSNGHQIDFNCDCLPSCTTLTYSAETSQVDFNWRPYVKTFYEGEDDQETTNITDKISQVKIFFRDFQFIRSERNELYGLTDFLANCGGLLGLFVGFSLLSLVEIVYFLTIRLFVNLKRHGRQFWSASDELISSYRKDREKQTI